MAYGGAEEAWLEEASLCVGGWGRGVIFSFRGEIRVGIPCVPFVPLFLIHW